MVRKVKDRRDIAKRQRLLAQIRAHQSSQNTEVQLGYRIVFNSNLTTSEIEMEKIVVKIPISSGTNLSEEYFYTLAGKSVLLNAITFVKFFNSLNESNSFTTPFAESPILKYYGSYIISQKSEVLMLKDFENFKQNLQIGLNSITKLLEKHIPNFTAENDIKNANKILMHLKRIQAQFDRYLNLMYNNNTLST